MTPLDPARAAITRRAAEGARLTRLAAAPRPRTGRRTQQAIDALLRLRTEIALGAAHARVLHLCERHLHGHTGHGRAVARDEQQLAAGARSPGGGREARRGAGAASAAPRGLVWFETLGWRDALGGIGRQDGPTE